MKKINLNPSSQKERLELEERKWAIEKNCHFFNRYFGTFFLAF